jgi:hypothetical protein
MKVNEGHQCQQELQFFLAQAKNLRYNITYDLKMKCQVPLVVSQLEKIEYIIQETEIVLMYLIRIGYVFKFQLALFTVINAANKQQSSDPKSTN